MSAAPARTEIELRMAEAMVDCAYSLGMAFADDAKAGPDLERRLKLQDAFLRSFQAVRLGIRLCLTLRSGAARGVPAAAAAEVDAVERDDAERPERETLQVRPDRERGDREADYEPVSLTRFLATLRGVAADAGRLRTDAGPGVLPRLQALLAEADGAPASKPGPPGGTALKLRPPPSPARARLLGSAAGPVSLPGLGRPRPPPYASG